MGLLSARRGVEEFHIDAVGDTGDFAIGEFIVRQVREPARDDDFVERESPGGIDVLGVAAPGFVMLDEKCLGALGRGKVRDPRGGFPPGGDDDIGVGKIVIAERAVVIDRGVRDAGAVEEGFAGCPDGGEFSGA